MPHVICKICKNPFYTKPSHIQKGWGRYCSAKCKGIDQKNGRLVACSICGNETYCSKQRLFRTKSGRIFCSKSCQTVWRNKKFSGSKHKGWAGGFSRYRTILEGVEGLPEKCSWCETEDKRVLAAHHVDGDHKNNDIKNLAWLCHNCHHLVHYDRVEGQNFLLLHQRRKK